MKQLYRSVFIICMLAGTLDLKAQVPVLNSYPSASAVIFLDFDGHSVTGTSWNLTGPIHCAPSGLTNTDIVQVFNRVAEDYRPFDINITTDSLKYLAAPLDKRMRIILTVTWEWYGNAGGVAFINSFTWGDDTPCFVFTSLLGYNGKNVSEASSHEAGHTLGLYHQAVYDANCTKISDYNQGQGNGEIGWAPIMGAGYFRNFTLWNNGPNPFGCSSFQNELDIITTSNGFGYRDDDHSGLFTTASPAVLSGNQFNVSGVIERNSDLDVFKFTLPSAGTFILNAVPYNVGMSNEGSDLDLQVTLYNNTQAQVNTYNPATLLHSVIDTFLTAGDYYLKIEGRGNLYAPNYASLGSYSLQGSFVSGNPLPLRRLELRGTTNNDKHALTWIIDADEQLVEQILEASTNGTNYTSISSLPVNARAYTYTPPATNTILYRMNARFDNGRRHYSNIVALRSNEPATRPVLMSNPVYSSTIAVSSPGNYNYAIYDLNGKTICKGKLTAGVNNIAGSAIAQGIYMIRFDDKSEAWTDKFMKW